MPSGPSESAGPQVAVGRSLPVPALIGVIVVYLVIIQGSSLLLTTGSDQEYGAFETSNAIVRGVIVPVSLSLLFGIVVVSWLGWWGRVLHETHRIGRWAWVFPGLMLVSILVVTDYPLLGETASSMIITLLFAVLLVGIGECLMYRGIALESMRRVRGSTEMRAALWAAVIFGGSHLSNIFNEGPGAIFQAVIVTGLGLFLYLALRVSGGLVVPILIHAGWDFSLFSANLGVDPDPYVLGGVAMATNVVLVVILIVRWHQIWPKPSAEGETMSADRGGDG